MKIQEAVSIGKYLLTFRRSWRLIRIF